MELYMDKTGEVILEGAEGLNIQSSIVNEDKVTFNEWMENVRKLRIEAEERPKMIRALKAIKARIDGEWDNPNLMYYGALNVNTETDILRIAEDAIGW